MKRSSSSLSMLRAVSVAGLALSLSVACGDDAPADAGDGGDAQGGRDGSTGGRQAGGDGPATGGRDGGTGGGPSGTGGGSNGGEGGGLTNGFGITTVELPAALVQRDYEAIVTAEGGTGEGYTWTLEPGHPLPPGLRYERTGTPSIRIWGQPLTAGSYEIHLRVTDDAGATDTAVLTLVVEANPYFLLRAPFGDADTHHLFLGDSRTDDAPKRISGSFIEGGSMSTNFAWAPSGRAAAFTANAIRLEALELFLVDVSNDSLIQPRKVATLMRDGASVDGFAWSPTSLRMAYAVDDTDEGLFELYLADLSGSIPVVHRAHSAFSAAVDEGFLPGSFRPTSLRWSGDGRCVAAYGRLESSDTTLESLFIVDAANPAGTVQAAWEAGAADGQRILHEEGKEQWAWSPTDTRLIVASNPAGDDSLDRLYLVRVVDGDVQPPQPIAYPISGHDDVDCPLWSPDGSGFAFRAHRTSGEWELFHLAVSASGSVGAPVPISDTLATPSSAVVAFSWSPDGAAIAYEADARVAGKYELYRATYDGLEFGTPKLINGPIVTGGRVAAHQWSADGRWLTYTANTVSAEVDTLFVWNDELTAARVVDLPESQSVVGWQLAPDGESLVAYSATKVWWVDLSSGTPADPVVIHSTEDGTASPAARIAATSGAVLFFDQAASDEPVLASIVKLGASGPKAAKDASPDLPSDGQVTAFKWAP